MAYNQIQGYAPGSYILTSGCNVTQTGDKHSAKVGGVDVGQTVQILEVIQIPGQQRIRGRINRGWITLKDTSSNKTWVRRAKHGAGFVQTHHGQFIMVSPQRQVTGNSSNKKEWEQLRITPIHGGRVQIMSSHNTYIGAKPEGSVYAEGHCKEWEMWFQEWRGDRFALKSHHGQYLTADQAGNLRTKHCQVVQDWELFRMVPMQSAGMAGQGQNFIRSHHGKYVMVDANSKDIHARSGNMKEWETITIQPIGGGRYTLRSIHNTFIGAEANGRVYADRPQASDWEFWHMENRGGRYAFKSHHGQYLTADQGGNLRTKSCQVQDWELFTLTPTGVGAMTQQMGHMNMGQNNQGFFPGTYTLTDGCVITQTGDKHSAQIGQVQNGQVVQVMEVCNIPGQFRIRGRIAQGWITLKDTQSQKTWVRKAGNPAQQPYAPAQQPYAPPAQQPYAPAQQPYAPAQQPYAPQGAQPMPQGSWIQSSRSARMQGNVLYCELNNGRGQFVPASVICYPGQKFKNHFGQFQPE